MLALMQHNNAELFVWVRGSDAIQYSPGGSDLIWHCPAKRLAYDLGDADNGKVVWTEVRYIQRLNVRAQVTKQVSEVAPHIQLLAGVGVRHRHGIVEADGFDDHDEAAKPVIDSFVDVQV